MSDPDQNTPPAEDSFEQAIARLETIAGRLEDPDTPLEESMALYEEGVRIARLCSDRLEAAELKIEELQADAGEPGNERPAG